MQIERNMDLNEDTCSKIMNKMPNGFAFYEAILDENGKHSGYKISDINMEFQRLFEVTREEVLGKPIFEIFTEIGKSLSDALDKVALSGKSVRFTKYSKKLNRYFDVSAFGIDGGKFVTIFNDITETKLYELKLVDTIENYSKIQSELSNLIYATQAVLELEDFQKAAKKLFDVCRNLTGAKSGYVALLSEDGKENEVLFLESGGLPCSVDPYLPMPIRGLRAESYKYAKAVYDNDFMKSEWIKFMPEGHVDLNNVMFVPLIIKEKVVGLIGLANKDEDFNDRDVSLASAIGRLTSMALYNSRQMEALKESEEKYKKVTENAKDLIYTYKFLPKPHFAYVSPSATEITGYTPEDHYKDPNLGFKLVHPDDKHLLDSLSVADSPSFGKALLLRWIKKNGEVIWTEQNNAPIFDEENNLIGIQGIARDITERKLGEQRIMELNDALGLLNKILRHDILNDLTIIMNALDLAESMDKTIKNKTMKAVEKSINLIEQMRQLEGALSFGETLEKIRVSEIIKDVIKNYQTTEFNINGDCTVLADEALSSVIDNIVRNAIVHGKSDAIDISIKEADGHCEVKISDNGTGIPNEIKDKIFDEGESFGSTRGSGLGLYIVKKVVEKYGGAITVEDNRPKGTTFTLKFKME